MSQLKWGILNPNPSSTCYRPTSFWNSK